MNQGFMIRLLYPLLFAVVIGLASGYQVLGVSRDYENYLAVRGKVIVSLPNARHFSLVLPLLRGRFDYVERGILDKTHLRFFTKDSATKLLETSGLNIELIKPTSLGLHLNSGKLNAITLGLFSGFITSQYIFKATAGEGI